MTKQTMKSNKRGQIDLGSLPNIIITLGLIAIILGVVATTLVQVQTTQCASDSSGTYVYANNTCYKVLDAENKSLGGTAAWNITSQGLTAQTTMSGWQNSWSVIAAASVIISLVAGFLLMRRQ